MRVPAREHKAPKDRVANIHRRDAEALRKAKVKGKKLRALRWRRTQRGRLAQ